MTESTCTLLGFGLGMLAAAVLFLSWRVVLLVDLALWQGRCERAESDRDEYRVMLAERMKRDIDSALARRKGAWS